MEGFDSGFKWAGSALPLRGQHSAAPLAAAFEYKAPCLGTHTFPKTVHAGSALVVGLKGSFHFDYTPV